MSPSLSGLGLASPGPSNAELADFTRRFEQFQLFEDEKAKFMTVRALSLSPSLNRD